MATIQTLIFVILLCFGLPSHSRHLNLLNSGQDSYRQNMFGTSIGNLVSSPSMVNHRPRKVMSKTFQTIINDKVNQQFPTNTQNKPFQNQVPFLNSGLDIRNFNSMPNNQFGSKQLVAPSRNIQGQSSGNIQHSNGINVQGQSSGNIQHSNGINVQGQSSGSIQNSNGINVQGHSSGSNQHSNGINVQGQSSGSILSSNGINNDLRSQLINLIKSANPQLSNPNFQSFGNSNMQQAMPNSHGLSNSQTRTINVQVQRKTAVQVPVPSLINKNVNGFNSNSILSRNIRKTPIITMVPKRKFNPSILQQTVEKKRMTMIEKLKTMAPISLSAIKSGASKTLQNAVTDRRKAVLKGSLLTIDSTKKIQVVGKNNTGEVKIINNNPQSVIGNVADNPNFIVLKDISITNTTDGANGTTNGTKMSITLMSQATGGRPIVIEAKSNIILSQEKMANGTVQFIIKTDTKQTTLGPTTPASTTIPTEEPEIEGEETTTLPTTTAEP